MSALDEVIEYSDGTYKQLPVAEARAELAQLRADVARLTQERDESSALWMRLNDLLDRVAVALMCPSSSLEIMARIRELQQERDEWKATAENEHHHLERARDDFFRRLKVVTGLWFSARRERDAAQAAVNEVRDTIFNMDLSSWACDDINDLRESIHVGCATWLAAHPAPEAEQHQADLLEEWHKRL